MAERTHAPGRDSIETAFRAVHGDAPVEHRTFPGDGSATRTLAGISAYRAADHWHFVTFGLTDLEEKTQDDRPQTSGHGHELTLTTPAGDHAPDWAFALLLGTAKVVFTHKRPFHAGARLAPGGPLDGARSALVALGLRKDPFVTPRDFPFGHYVLLQAVGITDVEYRLMQRAGTLMVLDRLAQRDPLLRTDLARG
ncbi:MAG: aminotransferase [Solirubrobacterales bacterium]|nr:aminotransferase [Solirubrobacterales bacterium]